jgi:hypothetical protein
VPFAYYENLSPASKRTYRKSDAIHHIEVAGVESLALLAQAIKAALAAQDRGAVEQSCQALMDGLNTLLATPSVRVCVLERRPSNSDGELQGLYEPDEVTGAAARITVWMRTAQREQIVKFRTFLRTLVHEACHHLDYELYQLAETFHTQGFYARESALMRELLGEPPSSAGKAP